MQLTQRQRRILTVLLESDDRVGMALIDIGNVIGTQRGNHVARPLGQMYDAGYVEDRWEGKPWPGESTSPDEPPNPKYPRRRYRITAKGKQVLMPPSS